MVLARLDVLLVRLAAHFYFNPLYARGFKNRQKSSLHPIIRSAGCFSNMQNQPFSPSFSAANFALMVGFLRTNLFTVKSSALLFASRRLFSEFSSAVLVFSS